jgi:hypothetical protein
MSFHPTKGRIDSGWITGYSEVIQMTDKRKRTTTKYFGMATLVLIRTGARRWRVDSVLGVRYAS